MRNTATSLPEHDAFTLQARLEGDASLVLCNRPWSTPTIAGAMARRRTAAGPTEISRLMLSLFLSSSFLCDAYTRLHRGRW
jgi:hypothetical protein